MENKTSFEIKSLSSGSPALSITKNNEADREYPKTSFDNDADFETPNEHLADKIIQQVEFLFSDTNILKDKFLLKHVRRNKEGYVSLKLVSSLRKVKTICKDWRVVAFSLRRSEKLQMNGEMTKIKRVDPLPEPEVDISTTVVVFHYLHTCWSFESVKRQLKLLGTVLSMEIFNSKAEVANVHLRKTLDFYENMATYPFAVVKFGTPDEAGNAVFHTSHPSSIILKVLPVMQASKRTSMSPESRKPCFVRGTEPSTNLSDRNSFLDQRAFSGGARNIETKSSTKFPEYSGVKCRCSSWRLQNEFPPQENLENKPLFSFTSKGDGPIAFGSLGKNRRFKISKQPQVIILRQPEGPDGTNGFRKRSELQRSIRFNPCAVHI